MGERLDRLGGWRASFAEHRRRQLTLGLAATPAQRLEWLEEAIELAHRTGALPTKRAHPGDEADYPLRP
jgi:hypothetical protein